MYAVLFGRPKMFGEPTLRRGVVADEQLDRGAALIARGAWEGGNHEQAVSDFDVDARKGLLRADGQRLEEGVGLRKLCE
jgi:hypothetical protein